MRTSMDTANSRWIPWALIGGLALVIAANGTMIWFAARSFPGAIENGFEIGTGYNRILDAVQRQSALGWTVQTAVEKESILLSLTDRAGKPLDGLAVEALAARPVGPADPPPLASPPAGTGRDRAAAGLAEGQWMVMLEAKDGAARYLTSRRILIP